MTLRDQDQRDRIRTALDENQLVLAGAGAGKTYALVERMVSTVRAGTPVEHLAAITFTRKAAGEMRERFQQRMRGAAQAATGEEAERLAAACDRVDRCFIGTVHAFCGRLLRERPVEAGLSPDFTEVEPREASALRRAAWDAFVEQRYRAGDARLDQLDALGGHTEDLFHFFEQRNTYREVPLKATHVPRPDLDAAVERVRALMEAVAAHVPADPPKGRDPCMSALVRAQHLLAHHGLQSDADRVQLLRLWAGPPTVKVTYWGEARAAATTLRDERLPAFDEGVLQPVLTQWRQHVYQHVTGLVDDAVDFYRDRRMEQGQLTFQDLLLRSAALLRDHPDVRRAFQDRYRRLFVDEFQDTDPIQARVLFYLAGADVTERDWRALRPEPGRLFLVGDAKQSIYRFRRADLDTFRFVADRLEATGGAVLRLNTSFRSLGAFCEWANTAFESVFGRHDAPYQADFAPLFKHRPEGDDAHCVRTLTLDKVHRNRREDIVRAEAGRIARFITAACAGDTAFNGAGTGAVLPPTASPGDFMILTRDRRPLTWYAEALEAQGLPYDLVGGGALGEADEVQALVDMLEVVHSPENPLPLISYLRGPLVGLGDDELRAYKAAGGAFDYRAPVPEGLDEPAYGRVQQAVERLRQATADLRAEAPAVAFERILDRLRLIPFAAARPLGTSRAGNLMRLQALVRQWASQGWHWGEIVTELRALVDDPEYEVEAMTLAVGRTDVVRVMNVHQAKGLQARVVFLADPYSARRGSRTPDRHVTRRGADAYLSMPVRRKRGEHHTEVIAEPEGWADDAAEEARYQAAEADRLLYVAATRARNLLVVSRYAPKPDDGPWSALAPALTNVPELPTHEAVARVSVNAPPAGRPPRRSDRGERVRRAERPSYAERGGGARFAAAARHVDDRDALLRHVLLAASRDALPDEEHAYLQRLVAAGDALDPADVAAAVEALARFRGSALWADLQRAGTVYTEVPFTYNEFVNGTERVVHGQIDLIYYKKNGWHLVVLDTAPARVEGEAYRAPRHGVSIEALAARWEAAAGQPVASRFVWAVEAGRRDGGNA